MRRPNFLDNLPKDKLLHFAIGCVAFAAMMPIVGMMIAGIVTFILGAAIEYYQRYTKTGAFEFMDMVAVWLGGATVALSHIDINMLLNLIK